jgi:hypothetical protein
VLALASSSRPASAQASSTANAERITNEFRDGAYQLLSRRALVKTLSPSEPLPEGDHSGFWFELRRGDESVRYRRTEAHPRLLVFDGPSQPSGTHPRYTEAILDQTVFALIVPAPENGDTLVLMSSPVDPDARGEAAQEVARFVLDPVVP